QPITVIHLEGTVRDAQGGLFNFHSWLIFTPVTGIATTVNLNDDSTYSAELLAGQYQVTAVVSRRVGNAYFYLQANFAAPRDLTSSQTFDVTLPTSSLTVSVRDLDGQPVTNAGVTLGINPVSTPAYTGQTNLAGKPFHVDANGEVTLPVITGTTLANPSVVLDTGLVIPFTVATMDSDRSVTVTKPDAIRLDGAVRDGQGGAFNEGGCLNFTSPSGAITEVHLDADSNYVVELLPGPYRLHVDGSKRVDDAYLQYDVDYNATTDFTSSRTFDINLPTSALTVSV